MSLSSEKLFKIFKLESEFGYENKAVVGGLQKLSESWAGEARAEGLSEALIPAIASILKHYPNLHPRDRWQALQEIGDLLDIPKIATLPKPKTVLVKETQSKEGKPASSEVVNVKSEPRRTIEKPLSRPATSISTSSQSGIKPKISKKAQEISRNPISDTTLGLDAPVTVIRGVGPKQAEHMKRLGLNTIEDLLYFFPRRYDDY